MQLLYKDNSSLKEVVDYLTSLKTPHLVIVEKPRRSVKQNSLWYWYVQLIADYTGYTPEQTKSILKQSITDKWILAMAERIVTKNGTEIIDYKSSADLKKDEFSLLMNYTMQLCDTMGIQYKYDPIKDAEEMFK